MKYTKVKFYHLVFYSFLFSFINSLLYSFFESFKINWLRFTVLFASLILIQTILLFFFNFYIKLNLNDIIFEGEKAIFITKRKKFIFEVKQCSKIIVKAKYYIFEFKEKKLALMVNKSSLEKKNVDFKYFTGAIYIDKNFKKATKL